MTDQKPQQLQFKTLSDLREGAVLHHRKGDLATARDLYRAYLARRPKDGPIWSNLGALFRSEKNYPLAVVCQQKALQIGPESDTVLNNAANALFDAGEPEKALALRRKALARNPSNPENWSSLGKYLRALGRYAEAKAELEKALRVHPDEPELHIQLSFALLALGDYPAGFAEFDWRWKGDEISLPEMPMPKWAGEDLSGKTLLVTPEQGFGDTILMARFLKGVADMGAEVRLSVKPPLHRVFKGLAGVSSFALSTADLEGCDYWVPMMDLPRYLGTTLQTLPAPTTLTIPQDSQDRASALLAPFKDQFKVGVLWSGSVTYRANHKRSFSHQQFLQLADVPNLQMFSLYKGPLTPAYHGDGTSCVILDAAGNDRDFADSAALIQQLDLVITMDSAIAHVAGSLGAKVWNLLHSEAYWLYEPFQDHTPWYPSMRLIRQEKSGDWDRVFVNLRKELEELVDRHG
ncbi:tetratricopeptide repeat protein [Neptunicoccus sediminis]|uniref:tetratricopeptide repeat protein n=1 Tax=Neptunicoccus sediminis TaxID=1892596 RepID=UPI000845CD96|nr:tetratricopeptide repeat protein [Neptunicoccus sediminis]